MAEQITSEKSFPIVGIGASAGGLDALQRFLAVLPQDFGFALVFIQHLSSKHKSLLPELLAAKRPSLVIQEISDGLKAQPGRLYLSPPGKEIRIQKGLFRTTVHPEGLIHLPIDEFLASLAEDAAEQSIAAIFSGAGTDGARGCQAVRSAGGTVFVQEPETAEFSSMPLAAIATGQADAVLPPEDICIELLKLKGIGAAVVSREHPITPEEFDAFFRLIREKTGSRFNHYKKSVVSRRVKRRMYLHGLSAVKDYLDRISADDSEAAHLASDLMIGVTSFFRDRVAWKALNLDAVRKLVAENTDLPVRVWTPASATGEEAYSIAMMLMRELDVAGTKRDVQVFATDVNDRALERAREGRYPASITADVPQEYIQKYFTSTEDGNCLIINKDVRECVVFARQDLLMDPPFSKLDLIICRNFMIYLEPEAQEKSITLFHYALKEGGFLFLGNAETVGRKSALFKSIGRKQCRIYRKLETKPASRLPISVPYATERRAQPAKQAQMTEQSRSVMEIIQEKLLEEYGPASVAIDQNHEISYHNGPTNRYLHQPRGVPTQNLLELLPESLRSRIRGAIYRASREEKTISIRAGLPLAGENPPQAPFSPSAKLRAGSGTPPLTKGGRGDLQPVRHVTLRITKAAENLYVVVFQEKGVPSREEAAEAVGAAVIEETAIHQLESELSATRQDLQSHIEQLKSLNEELQSSNEELQAANEELETSREELQSLNEELITVNSQLQGKIEEQDVTNNDLNNFQASTNIPTIFLDTHFRVKRFTPAMLKLIKLLPSDVGRPIIDMSQENLGPDLISDAESVLESLAPERQEMQINGAWYVRTTLPYRTADNRIEGVVVTYNDVSELKKSEERTRHLASFPELNPNPICEVHSSGKVTFCNPATERVLANLGLGMEDLTAFLPEDMDSILRDLEKNEESSFYREKAIGDRVFGMTVHLAPQFNVIRVYAYDITTRKRAEEELRASEERFRALITASSDVVYRMSPDWGEMLQLHGRNFIADTEKPNRNWLQEYIHPDDQPRVEAVINEAIRTKSIFELEHRVLRVDGTLGWTFSRAIPLLDANGEIVEWFGAASDITESKQAVSFIEARLRLAEAANKAGLTIAEVLRLTLDELENQTGSKIGFYHFLEADQETLTLQNWSTNTVTNMCAAEGAGNHYNISKAGVWVDCVRERKPIIHNDYASLPGKKGMPQGHAPVLREMVVPILRSGQIVAIIGMGNKETDYSAVDVELTKLLGDFSWEIVERKRAEGALKTSEEKYRRLIETANEGVIFAAPDGRMNLVNQKMSDMLGYPVEDIIGKIGLDFMPEDQKQKVLANRKKLGKQEQIQSEFCFLRKDGTLLWTIGSATPIFNDKGEQVGNLAMHTDITERKKAEEVQGRLSAIVASAEDAIISKDLNGVIQTWNVGAEKIFGYTSDEVIGKNISLLVPPDHADEVSGILRRLSQGGHIENFETVRMRKDGTIIPVSLNFSAIRDSNGKVIGASKIAHDITERKRAEEALRASNEELTRFNNAAVGRELRMMELKKELNELCASEGLPPRYRVDFEEEINPS